MSSSNKLKSGRRDNISAISHNQYEQGNPSQQTDGISIRTPFTNLTQNWNLENDSGNMLTQATRRKRRDILIGKRYNQRQQTHNQQTNTSSTDQTGTHENITTRKTPEPNTPYAKLNNKENSNIQYHSTSSNVKANSLVSRLPFSDVTNTSSGRTGASENSRRDNSNSVPSQTDVYHAIARKNRMLCKQRLLQKRTSLHSNSQLLSPTDLASPSASSTITRHVDNNNTNPLSSGYADTRKRNYNQHSVNGWEKRRYSIAALRPIPFYLDAVTQSHRVYDTEKGISTEYIDDGDATYICEACGAKLWYQETLRGKATKGIQGSFSLCCLKGKIVLPQFSNPIPELLSDLYNNKHPLSKHFIENIRAYNTIFSFTSMGGKIDTSVNKGRGPYTFRLRGQNCHKLGGLVPPLGQQPKYSQLYIYDTSNEAENRKRSLSGRRPQTSSTNRNQLDETLIATLMECLNEFNPLVKFFRMARDRFEDNPTSKFKIKLIGSRSKDGRTYNVPTVEEVAALIVGDIDMNFDERDIIIDSHTEGLQRISELHPQYLALQYPLIFVYAEDGYRPDIYHRDVCGTTSRLKKRVTMREFFAYKIQQRQLPSLLHIGRRLYQQLLVDAYTMVESERIRYIRNNQNILRCDSLRNITNAVTQGSTDSNTVGNRIKLPSSFTGSSRYMVENYRDAMALCRSFGYPDLFITFTCNPKWPEITRALKGTNLRPEDNPVLSARIFKVKLDRLVKDLKEKKFFGKVVADVYTVEFQKRGLPHAHICLFLDANDKMPDPEDVDLYISAEIPDKDVDPDLYKLVSDLMLHGPCGEKNPSCPCTDSNKKCTKNFPKEFADKTETDRNGYPVYRRRQDGRVVTKLGHDLDNRYVVPYNATLLKKYQAHLNVEWCNQVGSIRYLFKYINKGNDRVTAGVVDEETDEIKEYYDCRYISPCEAVWRIFSFDIHSRNPSVIRLPFHLEGEQTVIFDEEEVLDNVLNKPSVHTSMFLEWMNCNKFDQEANILTYVEFPSKFVWHQDTRKWSRRKTNTRSVGRIHHVSPRSGELFYLRILLNKVKGPSSFQQIRTVNEVLCHTYKDACYKLGLLDDDQEYIDGISEAHTLGGGRDARQLFSHLLLSDSMSQPETVFNKTFEYLSTDLYRGQNSRNNTSGTEVTEEVLRNMTLHEIEKMLKRNGCSLKDYDTMPQASDNYADCAMNHMIRDELSYDKQELQKQASDLKSKLNEEQTTAYETIMSAVDRDVGKTFLWKTLSTSIRSVGRIVLNVASSGIAALLLSGGRTAHSRFAIPLNPSDESFCRIKPNSDLAGLLKSTKLIIWDEAPMVDRHCVETLDRSLRDICRSIDSGNMDKPFGGKVVVFGGDFRQILPVIPRGKREEIVDASLNSSYLWKDVQVLKLTVNMRLMSAATPESATEIKEFADWILSIGNGDVGESQDGISDVTIPDDILITDSVDPIGTMISNIYPDFIINLGNPVYYQERAILAPTHEIVNIINDRMMDLLDGEEKSYLSSDSICQSDRDSHFNEDLYTSEYLNSIDIGGLPKHNLKLKVGVPVMLLRNIDQAGGLCNGTRLQITDLGNSMIKAKILTGTHVGTITCLSRMLIVPTDSRIPCRFRRRQYPISVCFGMTINKSQGQSLTYVGLFLQKPVFSHGQLYVALSRVTTKRGLKVLILDKDKKISNTTRNVVFKEVLMNM